MIENLHQLPWEIQITLASGYLGYVLGYAGIRDRHNRTDMVMTILVFGLIGYTAYLVVVSPGFTALSGIAGNIAGGVAALVASSAAGALWSWRGRKWSLSLLRKISVSGHDDAPNAWRSMLERTNEFEGISQISVRTESGVTYICDDTRRFEDAPFGTCLMGPDGSIGLYVTKWTDDKGEETKNETVLDPEWGAEMTFIPACRISGIDLRMSTS